jgi:hypothetical protein
MKASSCYVERHCLKKRKEKKRKKKNRKKNNKEKKGNKKIPPKFVTLPLLRKTTKSPFLLRLSFLWGLEKGGYQWEGESIRTG